MFFCALLIDITHFLLTSFLVSLPFIIICTFKCGLFNIVSDWMYIWKLLISLILVFVLSYLTLNRLCRATISRFLPECCLMPAVLVDVRWVSVWVWSELPWWLVLLSIFAGLKSHPNVFSWWTYKLLPILIGLSFI